MTTIQNENTTNDITTSTNTSSTQNNYEQYLTPTDEGLNIEANNIEVNCITSKNNKFSLDSDGNLTVNSITTVVNNLNVDSVYPVGSIYMSVNSTSPAILFGGTWERIQGKFLLGANDNSTVFNAGKTGGSTTVVLTTEQIPAHTHGKKTLVGSIQSRAMMNGGNIMDDFDGTGITKTVFDGGDEWLMGLNSTTNANHKTDLLKIDASHEHNSVGGGKAHNNMPPFLAVYIWKRIS